MKTNIVFILFALICLTACGDKPSEAEKEATVIKETENEKKEETTPSERIKDCEDFLDTYEAWTDDILNIMARHKDDPVALATSPEYTNTMMKGVNFMQDWATISFSCAMNPFYETRMNAIQEKMKKRQEELGLK